MLRMLFPVTCLWVLLPSLLMAQPTGITPQEVRNYAVNLIRNHPGEIEKPTREQRDRMWVYTLGGLKRSETTNWTPAETALHLYVQMELNRKYDPRFWDNRLGPIKDKIARVIAIANDGALPPVEKDRQIQMISFAIDQDYQAILRIIAGRRGLDGIGTLAMTQGREVELIVRPIGLTVYYIRRGQIDFYLFLTNERHKKVAPPNWEPVIPLKNGNVAAVLDAAVYRFWGERIVAGVKQKHFFDLTIDPAQTPINLKFSPR